MPARTGRPTDPTPDTPTLDTRTTTVPLATSNFLVPNGTFIVVLLAFLVVVWVIGKKVLPVLNKALTERQDQIRGELEAADKAKSDAEEADTERRAALDRARAQAREIVSNAATAADQTKLRAEADAQAIHDRILQAADAEVAIARQAAVEEVTARVGEIVLAAAERVIGREIRASDHQDLIDEAIAAVRAESSDAGADAAAGAGSGR
jgi:F-type H+-transporting ATPase subunit b